MWSIKHRVLAIIFTVLCLFSSVQLVLNHHFCCDQLVSICVNELGESCCADENDHHNSDGHLSKDCCDNETFLIEAVDFLVNNEVSIPSIYVQKANLELLSSDYSDNSRLPLSDLNYSKVKDHFSQRLFCVYRL